MPVDWDGTTRAEFDALCESLVRREHPSARVQVFDGAGGDGGRDVLVTAGDHVTVYQLKHFPGRIPARSPNRRSQVESSLRAAAQHDPDRWVLVVPTTLNQHEHTWFDGLAGTVPFETDLWDKTALNDACARSADLVVQHMRTPEGYLLEAVREFNAEKAVLGSRADLGERVAALGRRAGEQDPDWRWDFAYADGAVRNVLVPKHAGASETSPITIDVELAFTADNTGRALQQRWEAATQYGAPGTVSLPAGTVKMFNVDGPPFVAGERVPAGLDFVPQAADLPDQPVRLRVTSRTGTVLHELRGRTERWGGGARGHHINSFVAGLRVALTIDADPAGRGRSDVDLELARCASPDEALAAVRAGLDLRAPNRVELDVHPYRVRVPLPEGGLLDLNALRHAEQVMQDLVDVGRHLDLVMPVPARLTGAEVRDLRLAASLLAGGVAEMHRGTMTMTLTGEDSPVLQDILAGRLPGTFVVRRDHEVTVAGRVLHLGEVAMYARGTEMEVSADTRSAVARGRGAGLTFDVRPADGGAWLAKRISDLEE